eukprot:TRINITY_DN5395_c0_g1_i1.p1 TRINITY_DN5395_c0_g1~~TRINITY_DN5395_c0_g1_i1.p1  ORF type:complete len:298 (-),score=101.90 TRINITY_DN5395_c0_g1_i1:50-943(-)
MDKGHVHSQELFMELMQSADWESTTQPRYATTPPKSRAELHAEAIKMKQRAREKKQKEEIERENVERMRHLKDRIRRREEAFLSRMQKVEEGERTIVKDTEDFLMTREMKQQEKREKLFAEWNEKVFEPIQRQIDDKLEQTDFEALESQRRDLFEEFLEQTNTKGGMFRDIIIESEYNPLKFREKSLRYGIHDKKDPTLKPISRIVYEERSQEGKLPARVLSTKTREVFDISKWDRIEATPYGRYNRMMDTSKAVPRKETHKSSVAFDHYSYPRGYDALKQEIPKGKKVFRSHGTTK